MYTSRFVRVIRDSEDQSELAQDRDTFSNQPLLFADNSVFVRHFVVDAAELCREQIRYYVFRLKFTLLQVQHLELIICSLGALSVAPGSTSFSISVLLPLPLLLYLSLVGLPVSDGPSSANL